MRPYRSLTGDGVVPTRRFTCGATVVANQVVVADTAPGAVTDPSANDYTEMIGVTLEAGTYSTTQGTSNARVRCTFLPMQVYIGKVAGGTASTTDISFSANNALLTNSTAESAGTVVADANVGTSEFVGGTLVSLDGANKGKWRYIGAHSDNTSTTVTVPFDDDLAANTTFLRTFGVGQQGLELTTDWAAFNGAPGAGVDLPDTGHAVVSAILVDGFELENPDFGTIMNPTLPVVEVAWIAADHAFNTIE